MSSVITTRQMRKKLIDALIEKGEYKLFEEWINQFKLVMKLKPEEEQEYRDCLTNKNNGI